MALMRDRRWSLKSRWKPHSAEMLQPLTTKVMALEASRARSGVRKNSMRNRVVRPAPSILDQAKSLNARSFSRLDGLQGTKEIAYLLTLRSSHRGLKASKVLEAVDDVC